MSSVLNKRFQPYFLRLAAAAAASTVICLVSACATQSSDAMQTMAPAEQNRKVFHRIVDEVLNRHSTQLLNEVVGANYVNHTFPPGTPPGLEPLKGVLTYFWTAFPDLQFTFVDEVVEGNKIAGRGYFTGTHKGEFKGIAPTGAKIKVEFMDEWRFENGRWVEYWGVIDTASLLQQLGAIPKPAK